MRALLVMGLLAALLSPVAGRAQVTTLNQQIAIWDGIIQQVEANPQQLSNPATLTADARALVPQYGYWCGLQATPAGSPVVDGVDYACFQHDNSPGYSLPTPSLAQVGQADQQLIGNLAFAVASTPYGELYRNVAIQVFQAKDTYEQANQTTLVTPCSDCLPQP